MKLTQLDDWLKLRADVNLPSGMWINGGSAAAEGGATSPLVSPRDGEILTHLPAASAHDVAEAVRSARAAFDSGVWSRISPRERGEVLIRWADLIEQHRDEMALLISLEMGKPVSVAWNVELKTTIGLIRWYGELADKLMDESPRGKADALALVTREPMGVVAAITPWNFPMTLSTFKMPAALVAGNTVVLKPASQSPLSVLRAAELATEAGLPDGVLQVVTGSGPITGAALATDDNVATLTFTGSTDVGKQLLHYSADSNAKPVWLELGGKSPNIIFPDAPDMAEAISTAGWAIAFNSGQMCTAGSRLLVHRSIHDEVVAGVTEYLSALKIGDPLDPDTNFGPLASRRHRDEVLTEISKGKQTSAELVLGSDRPLDRAGWFVEPAIFTGVQADDRLAQHEIFGPVVSVLAFDDEDDAIAIANNSDYGLGSAVWTADLSRAARVSRRLDAGLVWVNCFEEGDYSVPFGGRKLSGHGGDKSVHGLEKFTSTKTTWMAI
ncbi:gamma-glutamyl-gamma-aminobutyraldehyde dehydrogenase [Williamsia muralis]|uniref:Gamma-glutamyl-gamma-aminobutyraldehyde dehydrogenase n=1 Tax=Williamsia marianensis TaxID=85044 RepID=A0A495KA02_WILMA|nr:aldehyde dehydrogenase family protein [Williamsia muralis]RKR97468.1 gamma-glutamyl-gamma-aminobutyraldehyde dehydrogenase [Williamsia muralis]